MLVSEISYPVGPFALHSHYRVELKRIASDVEKPFIRKSLCMLEERSVGKLTADFSTRLRALLSLLCKHGT